VGSGYRPNSVVAGYLAAQNQRYLADEEGIHVCQGNIWSQYAIDNGDGEGSLAYPYYPSKEHFCKPAQGPEDFIDCVNLDGWTMDFLCARRQGFADGFNSRLGVGPIECLLSDFPRISRELGMRGMIATTATHFDRGFELNGFAWVTTNWELALFADNSPDRNAHLLERGLEEYLSEWLKEICRRWPGTLCPTQGEFGLAWREHFKDNSTLDYRFEQRGTGLPGSEENLEIRWFMNRDFRLALLRDWKANGPEKVIDFTRYDFPAAEPTTPSRNWSLINVLNQKGIRPQDEPRSLSQFSSEDRQWIARRYPDLKSL
jgi:hypothetical protein